MSQNILQTKKENNNPAPSGEFIVKQIKRIIKSDFSTDDEGILQFNKNGYQANVNDILKAIDKWWENTRGNRNE